MTNDVPSVLLIEGRGPSNGKGCLVFHFEVAYYGQVVACLAMLKLVRSHTNSSSLSHLAALTRLESCMSSLRECDGTSTGMRIL